MNVLLELVLRKFLHTLNCIDSIVVLIADFRI